MKRQRAAMVVAILSLAPGAALASSPTPCGDALQSHAIKSLAALEQRQHVEDEALRNHPTASYSTMNGPVLRELEKRQQREALAKRLQEEALHQHHCSLSIE